MPPQPKPQRVVDPAFSQAVRERDGVCLWGLVCQDGCWGPLDPHHIRTRGSGGGDTLENGILLCRKHHDQAHACAIPAEALIEVLVFFYGCRKSAEIAEPRVTMRINPPPTG